MKPLSKLHAEAIAKAKTEQDKIKAAANAMIETPLELIKAILLKHEQAVIEVMRELSTENESLRQAIAQAESKSASDCDSPSWCNQYGKCHRSVIGAPMLANCIQGQEPVAVLMDGELFTMAEYEVIAEQGDGAKPLYVAPPKREWVGLTYEEISASVDICEQNVKGEFLVDYARAIEAKLREKNGF